MIPKETPEESIVLAKCQGVGLGMLRSGPRPSTRTLMQCRPMLSWGYMVRMEKNMETTVSGLGANVDS